MKFKKLKPIYIHVSAYSTYEGQQYIYDAFLKLKEKITTEKLREMIKSMVNNPDISTPTILSITEISKDLYEILSIES